MIKKMACVVFLSVASALAFAGEMGPVLFGRNIIFFAGGAAGVGMLQGNYTAFDPLNADTHYTKLANNNFLGGALFGAETVFSNNMYLALVGNALYNSQSSVQFLSKSPATAPVADHIISLFNNFQFGANLRIGMQMKNVTPYVLGGIEVGTWELGLANRSSHWVTGIAPNSDSQYKKTLIGPQAGLGTLIALNSYWGIGMEYAHSWLSHVASNVLDNSNRHFWRHKASVAQDQILFSVNYKFSL